jgi:ribosomal RNA-processing protein 7
MVAAASPTAFREVFGYTVLPVALGAASPFPAPSPKTASSAVAGLQRFLYARKHRSRGSATEENGPTLFVANLPEELDEAVLRSALARFFGRYAGDVVSVRVAGVQASASASLGRTRTAYVTFSDAAGLDRSLSGEALRAAETGASAPRSDASDSSDDGDENVEDATSPDGLDGQNNGVEETAMERLVRRYRAQRPERRTLQDETDKYVAAFEDRADEEEREKERLRREMDADGFTLVGAKRTARQVRLEHGGKKGSRKRKKGVGATELKNFYQFQIREAKRGKLATLRDKFELDKQRVARMKAARKFKVR